MGIFSEGVDSLVALQAELESDMAELEQKLEAARKRIHDANGLAERLVGVIEGAVGECRLRHRARAGFGSWNAMADELEFQLSAQLEQGGIATWDKRVLVEHAIAVVAELERRGIKTFKVELDADGNIRERHGGRDGT